MDGDCLSVHFQLRQHHGIVFKLSFWTSPPARGSQQPSFIHQVCYTPSSFIASTAPAYFARPRPGGDHDSWADCRNARWRNAGLSRVTCHVWRRWCLQMRMFPISCHAAAGKCWKSGQCDCVPSLSIPHSRQPRSQATPAPREASRQAAAVTVAGGDPGPLLQSLVIMQHCRPLQSAASRDAPWSLSWLLAPSILQLAGPRGCSQISQVIKVKTESQIYNKSGDQ